MILAAALLLQAPLTVGGFVDEMTARSGYGAVGISVATFAPIVLPDPGNAVDVDVRLKNRWRVVRDKAMPAVFRPEAAPYAEAFEETGPGVPYYVVAWADGKRETIRPGPKPVEDAKVERDDLFRPGGVRVSMARLAELLELKAPIPWIYRRRTAIVRLDPARLPEPIPLIAAIVGARTSADRKAVEFEPVAFRRLAVATLRAEGKKGPRPLAEHAAKRRVEEFAEYENVRPIWLEFGAQAHERATDAQLIELYAEQDRTLAIDGIPLTPDLVAFARRRLERLLKGVEPELAKRFEEVSIVHVVLFNVRGTGSVNVWSRDGSTVLDLTDVG